MPRPPAPVLLDNVALVVLREKDGQTKTGLAKKTGYSLGYINDLEKGRRGGNAQVIRALADALNVPASMLERRRGESAA
jgi:transcriptional regulator with XRE-family HTH domain